MLLLNGPNDGGGTTQCTVLIEKQVKTHKVTMGLMAAMMMATAVMMMVVKQMKRVVVMSADNSSKTMITRQVEDVLCIYLSLK